MAYNPDFKILFMSHGENENDFNELFEPGEGRIETFFENFVDLFTNFFTKLFRSAKANDEFVITTEATLPKVLNDSATYNHIYLSRNGDKRIQAFKTTYKDCNKDVETINIEYYNYNTVVKPLALNYYNSEDYSINYIQGLNKQIINIDSPKKLNDFENEFDWRTLTTQLRVNPSNLGDAITATNNHHDGVVDQDEFCDVSSEGTIYKYNNTDCNFWNSTYTQDRGHVSCTTGGQLDFSACVDNCIPDINEEVVTD
jgi:hypothetical protein